MAQMVLQNPQERSRGISGTTLKIIALIAMFIDHFAAIFLDCYLKWYKETYDKETLYYGGIQAVDAIMRLIGRFGFPLFAFLLVEGFQHTRSVKKYALNLAVFALISEVPFNLGFFGGHVINPKHQNVFFTLFCGLICIALIDALAEKRKWPEKLVPLFYLAAPVFGGFCAYECLQSVVLGKMWIRFFKLSGSAYIWIATIVGAAIGLLVFALIGTKLDTAQKNRVLFTIIPIIACTLAADALKTDYAGWGVITIWIMYLFRKNHIYSFTAGCIALLIMQPVEMTAFLMLIPVAFYNGKRGMKINKYVFYGFYPVHITLIYLFTLLCGYTVFMLK